MANSEAVAGSGVIAAACGVAKELSVRIEDRKERKVEADCPRAIEAKSRSNRGGWLHATAAVSTTVIGGPNVIGALTFDPAASDTPWIVTLDGSEQEPNPVPS